MVKRSHIHTNSMIHENDNHVISYLILRRWIGILGISLPWACWVANGLVNGLDLLNDKNLTILGSITKYESDGNLKYSISHFYYTTSGPLFIGIIVTVSIFLFCYTGHKPKPTDKWRWITDKLVTTVAAASALGIVIFPTSEEKIPDNIFVFTTAYPIGLIHYISAALFFIMMATLCLVNFRRRGNEGYFGSGDHDLLYRMCGWTILGSIAFVFVYGFFLKDHLKCELPITFIFEAIALTAFGTAWLFKGNIENAKAIRETTEFIRSLSAP